MRPVAMTVTDLNKYMKDKVAEDEFLNNVYVKGEISNFKISGRHAYFSLKDEFSVISAMIFNYQLLDIDFEE